jgi:hypothetical protein
MSGSGCELRSRLAKCRARVQRLLLADSVENSPSNHFNLGLRQESAYFSRRYEKSAPGTLLKSGQISISAAQFFAARIEADFFNRIGRSWSITKADADHGWQMPLYG